MPSVLAVTLPFFALILCGWTARAAGVIDAAAPRALNAFVLYFALPALLIRTLAGLPLEALAVPGFLAAWVLVSLAMFALVAVAARALRQSPKAAIMQAAAAVHGNVGYLGVSLVLAVLGPSATAAVSMAVVLDFLVIVPLVIALTELVGRRDAAPLAALAAAGRSAVANPFVISILAGLALAALGLPPTGMLDEVLRILGQAAVPAALFAIGATLHGQPLRAAGPELAAIALLKLVVHPILIVLVMADLFDVPQALIGPAALLAALPVANNVFVLATRYEARPGVVSASILATTAMALVTFNLWAGLVIGR
ncbi:MAG TPA: AEC family transporter [Paracoccaceae bacterium]|nr:AEC family transporter [Paracoccaceae bacterium]